MQSSQMASNPLVQSIVHASFRHAMKELGLPQFPQADFDKEIAAFLRESSSLFEDTPDNRKKIYNAVMRGEVIAAEATENLAMLFYVRGFVGSRGVDIRIVCASQSWHIDKVISMYSKKLGGARWLKRTAVIGAVIVAGLLGYALHGLQAGAMPQLKQSAARTVPSLANQSQAASGSPPSNASNTANASNATGDTGGSAANNTSANVSSQQTTPAVQTYSFTLRQGMSLNKLSDFLKSHHLVQSAVSFDMLMKKTKADRDVRPGTYVFKSNMTQQQLIQVVKQGPTGK